MKFKDMIFFIQPKSHIKYGEYFNWSSKMKYLPIELKNISFGYNAEKNAIDDVSLTANSNQKIAFVGRSGGGKSTIFNLITRFYDVKSGEILIDGINICDLSFDCLKKNIAVVSQDVVLFDSTIYENLENYEQREIYCQSIREKLVTSFPDLTIYAQETFDIDPLEIERLLRDPNEFLDPALFYRGLEELYDINIFVFSFDICSSKKFGPGNRFPGPATSGRIRITRRSC
jgi:hypothetical protein